MVALQLKYESNWAESYIYVNHLYRPFFWESLRDFIFPRPNDDSRYLQRTALKLSMLLALASAGRSSDLRALDLRYMTVKESCIVLELGRLTKSRKKGQCPLKLTFTAFDTNPNLCTVSAINCYLERTKGWRSDCNKNQLLLSYIKPHKEVVPCTIAGWLV